MYIYFFHDLIQKSLVFHKKGRSFLLNYYFSIFCKSLIFFLVFPRKTTGNFFVFRIISSHSFFNVLLNSPHVWVRGLRFYLFTNVFLNFWIMCCHFRLKWQFIVLCKYICSIPKFFQMYCISLGFLSCRQPICNIFFLESCFSFLLFSSLYFLSFSSKQFHLLHLSLLVQLCHIFKSCIFFIMFHFLFLLKLCSFHVLGIMTFHLSV